MAESMDLASLDKIWDQIGVYDCMSFSDMREDAPSKSNEIKTDTSNQPQHCLFDELTVKCASDESRCDNTQSIQIKSENLSDCCNNAIKDEMVFSSCAQSDNVISGQTSDLSKNEAKPVNRSEEWDKENDPAPSVFQANVKEEASHSDAETQLDKSTAYTGCLFYVIKVKQDHKHEPSVEEEPDTQNNICSIKEEGSEIIHPRTSVQEDKKQHDRDESRSSCSMSDNLEQSASGGAVVDGMCSAGLKRKRKRKRDSLEEMNKIAEDEPGDWCRTRLRTRKSAWIDYNEISEDEDETQDAQADPDFQELSSGDEDGDECDDYQDVCADEDEGDGSYSQPLGEQKHTNLPSRKTGKVKVNKAVAGLAQNQRKKKKFTKSKTVYVDKSKYAEHIKDAQVWKFFESVVWFQRQGKFSDIPAITLAKLVQRRSSGKGVSCKICHKEWPGHPLKLIKHVYSHAHGRNFSCLKCGRVTRKKHYYDIHLDLHRLGVWVEEEWSGSKQHACQKCNKYFPTGQSLREHDKMHEKEGEPYQCGCCGQAFSQSRMRLHHEINAHWLSQDTTHRCPLCDQTFRFRITLRRHMQCHKFYKADLKVYACDKCPETFGDVRVLLRHARKHDPNAAKCEKCGKLFSTKHCLASHTPHCTAGKPPQQKPHQFQCEQCGKLFTQKASLDRHTAIHSGERRFECKHCGMKFNQDNARDRHVKLHFKDGEYRDVIKHHVKVKKGRDGRQYAL